MHGHINFIQWQSRCCDWTLWRVERYSGPFEERAVISKGININLLLKKFSASRSSGGFILCPFLVAAVGWRVHFSMLCGVRFYEPIYWICIWKLCSCFMRGDMLLPEWPTSCTVILDNSLYSFQVCFELPAQYILSINDVHRIFIFSSVS